MASAVVSDNFETGSGQVPQLGGTGATTCKAWVNFNSQGTVTINDSYNVASITDNGIGNYTINFTTTMGNNFYSVNGMCRGGNSTDQTMEVVGVSNGIGITVASCNIRTSWYTNFYDPKQVYAQVFSN